MSDVRETLDFIAALRRRQESITTRRLSLDREQAALDALLAELPAADR